MDQTEATSTPAIDSLPAPLLGCVSFLNESLYQSFQRMEALIKRNASTADICAEACIQKAIACALKDVSCP